MKLNSSQKALRLKSTKTSNETPRMCSISAFTVFFYLIQRISVSRPRKQRTRASAGEDKVLLEDVSGVDIEKKSCCVIANITTVAAPSCMEATLISKSSSKETATVRCEGAAVISMTSSESVAGSPKLSSKTAADSPKFPTKSTTGSPKTSSKLAVSSPKPSKEWPVSWLLHALSFFGFFMFLISDRATHYVLLRDLARRQLRGDQFRGQFFQFYLKW